MGDQLARCIYGVNLDDVFCQIGTNSSNLALRTSPFKGFRLNATTQSWHLMQYLKVGSSSVFR